MAFQQILEQTIILFLMILVGWYIRKKEIITDSLIKGFSEFVLNVTLPLFIIVSMDKDFSMDRIKYTQQLLAISVFAYTMKAFISKWFTHILKIKDPQAGVHKLIIIFSNSAFVGIPVAGALYGDDGVFYAAILNITFNLFLWTIGVKAVDQTNQAKEGNIIKNLLLTPGIFSVIIGIIFFLTPLKLPNVLYSPMYMIGSMTTPLAMIVVGGLLGGTEVGDTFKNKQLIASSLIRLVVVPMILLALVVVLKLPPIVAGITIIIDAMPVAASTAIFARKYESDYNLASQGVFLSTLINIVTTPLILYIFTKVVGV